MQTCVKPIGLLVLLAALSSSPSLRADEPLQLERLPLAAEDISGVLGLNIYKFRIPVKPSTQFKLVVSVQDTADDEPRVINRNSFTSSDDAQTVDLLLSFLPRDNTLRGVLLSQDEEVSYRVDCSQCDPSGISTIISLPLNDVRGTEKTLIPMTKERSATLSDENEICLIAILASKDGKPASMQESYPRAKVSVTFSEQPESRRTKP